MLRTVRSTALSRYLVNTELAVFLAQIEEFSTATCLVIFGIRISSGTTDNVQDIHTGGVPRIIASKRVTHYEATDRGGQN
jgi:hypothetical protein